MAKLVGKMLFILYFLSALSVFVPSPVFAAAETSGANPVPRAEMDVIEGVYAGPGVECPLFKLTDGRLITLSGKLPALETKATFELTGRWVRISTCMQGDTFQVFDATEVKDAP